LSYFPAIPVALYCTLSITFGGTCSKGIVEMGGCLPNKPNHYVMTARKNFIVIVLFAATIDWALWLGGQFFNALMIIPGWSSDPPASIRGYQQHFLPHIHAYFFMVANPLFLLPFLILAWALCRRRSPLFAKWLAAAPALDLFITLLVGLWMAPAVRGIFSAAAAGTLSGPQFQALAVWRMANAGRILLGVITLFFLLISIAKLHLLMPQKKRTAGAAVSGRPEPC
jgi:hypothetical protein